MNDKITNIINQINSSNAIILEGAISVLSALGSDVSKIYKIILRQDSQNRNIRKVLTAAKKKNVETEIFSVDEMRCLEEEINASGLYSVGRTHGGIIAISSKRKFLTPDELISSLPTEKSTSVAIIEGIEDPYNLGYAARALYTQGTDALILPERDFGFSEAIIEKASTGTFSKMPTAVFSKDLTAKTDLINLLKKAGFKIYCIEKKAPANTKIKTGDIFNVKFSDRTVFIIGGEKRGISKDFIINSDEIVSIPYAKDFSHSLAAQTAATIISYEIHRQKSQKKLLI